MNEIQRSSETEIADKKSILFKLLHAPIENPAHGLVVSISRFCRLVSKDHSRVIMELSLPPSFSLSLSLSLSLFLSLSVFLSVYLSVSLSLSHPHLKDHGVNSADVASTMAHEMGHNMGFVHDTEDRNCKCEAPASTGCVMEPSSG